MHRIAGSTVIFSIFLAFSAQSYATTAQSILETARQKQIERWEGVTHFSVSRSIAGNIVTTHYKRIEVDDGTGQRTPLFIQAENPGSQANTQVETMTPEQWEAYATALEDTGKTLSKEQQKFLRESGLPPNMLSGMGASEPWASPDPAIMMGSMATFARGAGQAQQNRVDHVANAKESQQAQVDFAARAKLVGTETVHGRSAFHLRASDLDQVHETEDGKLELSQMSVWIDTEHYVPLRTRMNGTMTRGRDSQPIVIERESLDYRNVPQSRMYRPHRRLLRMSGMMDAKQQAELEKARKQMGDLEQQLAAMPPNQRAMMERMVGPQLEMIRRMAESGAIETEIVVTEIRVNS